MKSLVLKVNTCNLAPTVRNAEISKSLVGNGYSILVKGSNFKPFSDPVKITFDRDFECKNPNLIDDSTIHCFLEMDTYNSIPAGVMEIKNPAQSFPLSSCKILPLKMFDETKPSEKGEGTKPKDDTKAPTQTQKEESKNEEKKAIEEAKVEKEIAKQRETSDKDFLNSIQVVDLNPLKGSYYGGTKICLTLNKKVNIFLLKSITVGKNFCIDVHFPKNAFESRFKEKESANKENDLLFLDRFRFSESESETTFAANAFCCFTQAEVWAQLNSAEKVQMIPEPVCLNFEFSIQKCSTSAFNYVYTRSSGFYKNIEEYKDNNEREKRFSFIRNELLSNEANN